MTGDAASGAPSPTGSEAGAPVGGAPLLAVAGIEKSFPGVRALVDVSFDVEPGEVMRCSARTAPANPP
ncbi:MAG: hypothetical protein ACLPNY_23510 [Roseiarcus sp.]